MAGPAQERVGSPEFLAQFDKSGAIIANVVAHIIAAVPSTLYAIAAPVLVDTYDVTTGDIAILVSAGMAMTMLASLLVGFNVYRLDMRTACGLGMVLHIAGSLVSLFAGSWTFILVGRVLGAIGDGTILSASNAVLGRSKQNTRNWGISGVVTGLSTTAASYGLGVTLMTYGDDALFFGLLLAGLVALPLMMLIPRYTLPPEHRKPPEVRGFQRIASAFGSWIGVTLLMGGCFVAFGDSMVWFFNGIIGDQAGLTSEQIGTWVGAAYFAATFGALIAAVIGHRFGRMWPLIILGSLCAVGTVLLGMADDLFSFAFACVLMMGTFRAIIPFLYGTCARQDQSGGINAMFTVAVGLGGVIGPLFTNLLLGDGESFVLPGIVGAAILLTGALIHAFISYGHERADAEARMMKATAATAGEI